MKKYGNSALVSLVILLAGLLMACPSPFSSTATGKGVVTVQFNQDSQASRGLNRTVVADFLADATAFRITLKDPSGIKADMQATAAPTAASVMFELVPAGTWDVLVEALAGTEVIATASLAAQVVADNSVNSWDAGPLVPVQSSSGTLGNFSLAISLPVSAGITGLDWRLENSAGGVAVASSAASFASAAGSMDATMAANALTIGQYSLVMEFKRGSVSAGIFREAVNIWGGLTSNKWINPADGALLDKRTFGADEFISGNAVLSSLSVVDDQGNSLLATTDFASSMTTYNAGVVGHGNKIAFTPVESVAGQNISYSWNSQAGPKVLSGQQSRACVLVAGTNTLAITVTASDRITTHVYTLTFSWVPSYVSPSSVAMEMVQVDGGTFTMGDDSSINDWMKPAHSVTVSGFLMGKYEVTQAQYYQVMGSYPSDYAGADQDSHPVETLTRQSAYVFCNKLSELEGLEKVYPDAPTVDSMPDLSKNGYRLPTDAEWEFAARGGLSGSSTVYPGSNTASDVAVFGGGIQSAPVGSRAPNGLGIFDLAGNVAEFCDDWINGYYDGGSDTYPGAPAFDPLTPVRSYNDSGSSRNTGIYDRSLRGGGHDTMDTAVLRPAYREPVTTHYLSSAIGFRVVRGARALVRMVDIPAGTEPSTGVSLPAFKMGATEVTQGQFQAVMGYSVTGLDSSVYAPGDDIPARSVSFYDALVFCNKLSVREGLQPVYTLSSPIYYGAVGTSQITSATVSADFSRNGYRLPTLSERIWAVRGGTSTAYYWGTNLGDSVNYEWTSENTPSISGVKAFMPVGRNQPNLYGLYDISGNAYEWCWGSDSQNLMVSKLCGGTSRNPADSSYMSPLAVWDCSANCGPGYYDNGFRVVRGVLSQVVYDPNGGIMVASTTSAFAPGAATTLYTGTGIIKGTTELIGFRDNLNGAGTFYTPGQSLTLSGAVVLYAQWGELRAYGPGGGLIFYDKGTFDNTPAGTDSWRYLEASPVSSSTQFTGAFDFNGSDYDSILNSGTITNPGIGWGEENTVYLATHTFCPWNLTPIPENYRYFVPGSNIMLFYNLTLNGCDDWFLPSDAELVAMHDNLGLFGLGGIVTSGGYYWSSNWSSSWDTKNFVFMNSDSATTNTMYNSNGAISRAIRRF